MRLTRRDVIRQSALWAGVAALWASLPARTWAALERPPGWSDGEESLLTLIGDTIIPTTDGSPGAGAVAIGRFIITQATDCYTPEAPETLRRGLREIAEASQRTFAKEFADLNVVQREQVLIEYESRPVVAQPKAAVAAAVVAPAVANKGAAVTPTPAHPFRLIKELTLLGYFTSEPGATQALRYLPVPGGYKGSLKLGKDERSWAL